MHIDRILNRYTTIRQTLGYVIEQGVMVVSLTIRDNKPLEVLAAKCCLHILVTLIC